LPKRRCSKLSKRAKSMSSLEIKYYRWHRYFQDRQEGMETKYVIFGATTFLFRQKSWVLSPFSTSKAPVFEVKTCLTTPDIVIGSPSFYSWAIANSETSQWLQSQHLSALTLQVCLLHWKLTLSLT
jgi:hypothetical protein